jgi:hypothetical protein
MAIEAIFPKLDWSKDSAALALLLAVIDIVCRDAPVRITWDDFFDHVFN